MEILCQPSAPAIAVPSTTGSTIALPTQAMSADDELALWDYCNNTLLPDNGMENDMDWNPAFSMYR